MKTMGHRDVRTAMHYQHPELEVVRSAVDCHSAVNTPETNAYASHCTSDGAVLNADQWYSGEAL